VKDVCYDFSSEVIGIFPDSYEETTGQTAENKKLNQFKVNIVDYEGERLFELDGVMFDRINVYLFAAEEYRLLDGQISIIRDGQVFDKTTRIGGYRDGICFCGFKKLLSQNNASHNVTEDIYPEDCQIGDIIVIEIESFDFEKYLHICAREYTVWDEIFQSDVGRTRSYEENKELVVKVAADLDEQSVTNVVYFIRNKPNRTHTRRFRTPQE